MLCWTIEGIHRVVCFMVSVVRNCPLVVRICWRVLHGCMKNAVYRAYVEHYDPDVAMLEKTVMVAAAAGVGGVPPPVVLVDENADECDHRRTTDAGSNYYFRRVTCRACKKVLCRYPTHNGPLGTEGDSD